MQIKNKNVRAIRSVDSAKQKVAYKAKNTEFHEDIMKAFRHTLNGSTIEDEITACPKNARMRFVENVSEEAIKEYISHHDGSEENPCDETMYEAAKHIIKVAIMKIPHIVV